uniref:Uncharacterized protein n=1 Tax=Hemiselmis tepida TaxID=464990 RepID=A0A7S0VYE0_9CRYP|mmetsp:Transcript_33288/g.85332  ORF Transcript_33288/g.85332 Transcript_33288/m.85332 type:complete len:211 (+) Transcript_33288:73-705(+)|eukprot:CAMPEP_0174924440 /NCGR_PEP_ID=MMETSP1355-20121228/7251_1 /TAXON_ID=464990 /ORGANISM="Hemiselmis tepida, Strain CCMP443" /LENGTH=210 /DNA_ID=CAMNT_0016170247 /DNA_START=66 /DNA_END=698 /DNA_ORIENTATION=+
MTHLAHGLILLSTLTICGAFQATVPLASRPSPLLLLTPRSPLLHSIPRSPRTCALRMSQLPGGGPDDFFGKTMRNFQAWTKQSGLSGLVFPSIVLALFFSGQFRWLFELVNVLFLLAFAIPLVGVAAFQIWVKTSVVNGKCPSCNSPATAIKGQESVCFSCGAPLIVEDGEIARKSVYAQSEAVDTTTGKATKVDVVDVEVIDIDGKEIK